MFFFVLLLVGAMVSKATAQSVNLVDNATARVILKNQIEVLTPQMGTDPTSQVYQTLGRKVIYYGQILYMIDHNYTLSKSIEEGVFVLQASDENVRTFMNVPSPEAVIRNLVSETTVLLSN